ncbi:hypothetical protein [Rhodococcus ruber]|uniref:hypothetical protein n=1 Tax=Rhodococcus ruber TaxID=1830 RepID=UPI001267FEE5
MASPEVIVAASHQHEMSAQGGDQIARSSHGNLLAIARIPLFAVLQQQAQGAGVRLPFGNGVASMAWTQPRPAAAPETATPEHSTSSLVTGGINTAVEVLKRHHREGRGCIGCDMQLFIG